ncbi:metal-sensing transcriptional repressor [Ideonella sp. DXS29W]|uniref:Metal-sensing transcriptional repressor n=1 Tax=Ideonella lacteola TaxID=2984193 RepID=A0ABU9BWR3_9BURK
MATLTDDKTRQALLNRLRRAEGQLRGLQRMIEEGQSCLDIAGQLAAVRKALDSTHAKLTVAYMEQELGGRMPATDRSRQQFSEVLSDVQTLLGKLR